MSENFLVIGTEKFWKFPYTPEGLEDILVYHKGYLWCFFVYFTHVFLTVKDLV